MLHDTSPPSPVFEGLKILQDLTLDSGKMRLVYLIEPSLHPYFVIVSFIITAIPFCSRDFPFRDFPSVPVSCLSRVQEGDRFYKITEGANPMCNLRFAETSVGESRRKREIGVEGCEGECVRRVKT